MVDIYQTLAIIAILLFLKVILHKIIKRVAQLSDIDKMRTKLIIKYINGTLIMLGTIAISFTWGADFKELGLFLSSAFAIIGVALFAQWSILSNITAGVVLFFSFTFKIGDRIRIQDKDFPTEALIEDIKAFHIHLRTDDGELITYPNNLLLQKGVSLISKRNEDDEKSH